MSVCAKGEEEMEERRKDSWCLAGEGNNSTVAELSVAKHPPVESSQSSVDFWEPTGVNQEGSRIRENLCIICPSGCMLRCQTK